MPWLIDTAMNTNVAAQLIQLGFHFAPFYMHVDVAMHLIYSSVVNDHASFGTVGELREIAGRAVAIGEGTIMDLDDDESGGGGGPKYAELLHKDTSPTREKLLGMYGIFGIHSDNQRKWMF
ncbi:hypothetical protein F5X99DRAFT_142198 [Biscogniauxia marginata]|nr:hypothetical protein F5X99DRAFT_142198 [Biscogniauxia marginata]